MAALMLSRIQFGVTVGFHYLFPVTTLGLTFFILIFESLYLIKKTRVFRAVSSLLIKILGLIFTAGVATGLTLPFAFGANWSRFSSYAGAIFGAALSLEALAAFALESAFLAVLIFGRSRVSPFLYWVSAFLVFFGAHLSGFLIVAANSWMHTPAGYAIQEGRMVLDNYWQALFNPSTGIRCIHVITAAWLTGAVVCAGIASYYLLQKKNLDNARLLMRFALPLGLVLALLQPFWGHFHILEVLHYNPEKDAAYEGIFKTTNGAILYAFGIPDEKNGVIKFGIGIPYALSFLESGYFKSEVRGLEEYPRENWPPVNVIFTTFHLMVMLGVAIAGVMLIGVFLLWKKQVESSPWFLKVLLLLLPLPYLANELGWIGTEIGRQPWIIYGVLRTAQASTLTVPAGQIVLSLAGFCLLYLGLFCAVVYYVMRILKQTPESV